MICAFLSICGCAQSPGAFNFAASADAYFGSFFKANEPGAAILVMKNGQVVFSKGYGIADIKTKEKITPQTVFNTGSVSKTFVANAILILQERGKLSIEDPVGKYFTFKNPAIGRRIRIKHFLSHTSGIPDLRPVDRDRVFYLTAKDAENFAPLLQADTLLFEPGSRFEYSNPAYNGLALIVEKVSGMKWQAFVKQEIFDKAGMSKSCITDGPFPDRGVSHAYRKIGGQFEEYDYGEYPTFCAAGNGGVWSSVDELARYEQALRDNLFLTSSSISRSRTILNFPNWKGAIPPAIGYAWFIGKTAGGLKTVSHTGHQAGFVADYFTVPEKDLIYVFLTNQEDTDENLPKYRQKMIELMQAAGWLNKEIKK